MRGAVEPRHEMYTDLAPCWQMKSGMSSLSPTPMVTTRCPLKCSKPRIADEWMISPKRQGVELGRTGWCACQW